jgi:hypothetical protein
MAHEEEHLRPNQLLPNIRQVEERKAKKNEYLAIVKQAEADGMFDTNYLDSDAVERRELSTSLESSVKYDPARAGNVAQLSSKTGIPAETVERRQAEVEARNKYQDLDIDKILNESPVTARYLSDPRNARQAHDDTDNMGELERTFKGVYYGARSGLDKRRKAELRRTEIFGGGLNDEEIKEFADIDKRLEKQGQFMDWMPGSWTFSMADQFGMMLASGVEAVVEDAPEGMLTGASIGMLYGGAGGTLVAPGIGTAVGAGGVGLAGGIYGGATTALAGYVENTGELMFDEAYSDLVDEYGLDPETAKTGAMAYAAAMTGVELYGQKLLAKAFGIDALIGKAAIKQIAKQLEKRTWKQVARTKAAETGVKVGASVAYNTAEEGVQKAVVIGLREFLEDNDDPYDTKQFDEDIAAVGTEMAMAFRGMGLGSTIGGGFSLTREFKNIEATLTDQGRRVEATRLIQQSKLKENNPEAFKALMRQYGEEYGVETVYMESEGAAILLQDDVLDKEFIENTETGQKILEASQKSGESGSYIEIPVEAWANDVAGQDIQAKLEPYMKMDLDAQTDNERVTDDINADIEAIKALGEEDRVAQAEVYVAVRDARLNIPGVSPQAAEQEAIYWEAFFRTQARRLQKNGVETNAKKLFDEHAGKIIAEVSPDLQARAANIQAFDNVVDRIRAGDLIAEEGSVQLPDAVLTDAGKEIDKELGAGIEQIEGELKSEQEEIDSLQEALEQTPTPGVLTEEQQAKLDNWPDRKAELDKQLEDAQAEADSARVGVTGESDSLAQQRAQMELVKNILDEAGLDPELMTNEEIREALSGMDPEAFAHNGQQPERRAPVTGDNVLDPAPLKSVELLNQATQKKWTGKQLLAYLKKRGLTNDEIELTQIDEFLGGTGEDLLRVGPENVTTDEVLAYLDTLALPYWENKGSMFEGQTDAAEEVRNQKLLAAGYSPVDWEQAGVWTGLANRMDGGLAEDPIFQRDKDEITGESLGGDVLSLILNDDGSGREISNSDIFFRFDQHQSLTRVYARALDLNEGADNSGVWYNSKTNLNDADVTFLRGVGSELIPAFEITDPNQGEDRSYQIGVLVPIADEGDGNYLMFRDMPAAEAFVRRQVRMRLQAVADITSPEDDSGSRRASPTAFGRWSYPGASEKTTYRELLLVDPDNEYASDHWDQQGVIAHVRMSIRMTPDGKKVLVIEEMQADLHQEGRKAGYTKTPGGQTTPAEAKKWAEDKGLILIEWSDGSGNYDVYENRERVRSNAPRYTFDARGGDIYVAAHNAAVQGRYFGARPPVPDAPFKKTWPDVLIKKAMDIAELEGADFIAWTPSAEQYRRYPGLGQPYQAGDTVDVYVSPNNDLHVELPGQDKVFDMSAFDGKPHTVEDLIADVAEYLPVPEVLEAVRRIHAQYQEVIAGQRSRMTNGIDAETVTLSQSGVVGSQGMRKFYDVEVSRRVKKITKQDPRDIVINVRPETMFSMPTDDDAAREETPVHAVPYVSRYDVYEQSDETTDVDYSAEPPLENPANETNDWYRAQEEADFRNNKETGLIHFSSSVRGAQQFQGSGRTLYSSKLKVANAFDFRDKNQLAWLIKQVVTPEGLKQYKAWWAENYGEGDPFLNNDDEFLLGYMQKGLEDGLFQALELPFVVDIIKGAGHDAIFMQEDRGSDINIAVFFSAQATGGGVVYEGQDYDDSYRIQHTAPTGADDGSASLDKLDEMLDDFYDLDSRTRATYYGQPQDKPMVEALDALAQFKGKPDAEVTIYRVVPGDVDDINPNDWVTHSRFYAEQMLDDPGIANPKILEQKVRAGDLYWNGDSPAELGYSPKSIGRNGEKVGGVDNVIDLAARKKEAREQKQKIIEAVRSKARDLIDEGQTAAAISKIDPDSIHSIGDRFLGGKPSGPFKGHLEGQVRLEIVGYSRVGDDGTVHYKVQQTWPDGTISEVDLTDANLESAEKLGGLEGLSRNGDKVSDVAAVYSPTSEPTSLEDKKWANWNPPKFSSGKYRGVPKGAETKGGFRKLRNHLEKLMKEGSAGRYWYEDSAEYILQVVQGDVQEAEKLIQLIAIYSPQANVQVNTYFAINAWNQYKNGASRENFKVKTETQDQKAIEVLYDNKPFSGRKTSSFYKNLMHQILVNDPESFSKLNLDIDLVADISKPVTVDMWILRAFGYSSDAASDDVAGTGRYSLAENEIRRMTARLNMKLEEGQPRYNPHQVQAMIWSSVKARYELDDVKAATIEESIAKGLTTIDENGNKQYPQDAAGQRQHRAIWRKHAMKVSQERATEAVEGSRLSFADFLAQMTEVITWEAMPSRSLGLDIANASPEVQQEFTRRAMNILMSAEGEDQLAQMLGVPIAFIRSGEGGYEGNITPNALSHLIPTKRSGAFSVDEVRAYASAIQYIFKQDNVPWFRADPRATSSKQAAKDQQFKVINTGTGRMVPNSRADTLSEAQATAEAKGEGFAVQGGKYARGVALTLSTDMSRNDLRIMLKSLQKHIGDDARMTLTAPNEVLIVNFRGDNGVPFMDDEVFFDGIENFIDAGGEQFGIEENDSIWTEGDKGYVHNWQEDPTGSPILEGSLAGSPDLQAWVRDRRTDFERLLELYSGEQLEEREAETSLAVGRIDLVEEDSEDYQADLALFGPRDEIDTARDQAAANYLIRVEQVATQQFPIGLDAVNTPEEAAHVVAPLRKHAQESFLVVVLDKDNRPISVIRHSKGAKDASSANLLELVGAVAATEGAHSVWLGHNHPSGVTTPSKPDHLVTARARKHLADIGVELRGHVIVGDGSIASSLTKGRGFDNITIKPAARRGRIDVTERVIRKRLKPTQVITDQISAMSAAESIEPPNGLILLNNRNMMIGFMPLDIDEMLELKGDSNVARQILATFDSTNTAAVILKTETAEGEMNAAANMSGFLNSYSDLRFLDWIFTEGDRQVSATSRDRALIGQDPGGNPLPGQTFEQSDRVREGESDEEGVARESRRPKKRPRGYFDPKTRDITLTDRANPSTFLHESGHLFLEIYRDLAPMSPEIQADLDIVMNWAGFGGRDINELSKEEYKTLHEKFASGFEAYLFEGKAPVPELQGVFSHFQSWLVSVYKSATSIFSRNKLGGVELSDEVRQMMHRMAASQDQIEQAEQAQKYTALPIEQFGKKPEEVQAYLKAVEEAELEAEQQMNAKIMAELRRTQEKWWKVELAEFQDDVLEEIENSKRHAVRQFLLGKGEFDGIQQFKLDTDYVATAYGEKAAADIKGMTKKGGMNPDDAARILGYDSGEALVLDMGSTLSNKEMKEYAKSEALSRMKKKHGDMVKDNSLYDEAQAALHNDKQAKRHLLELRLLNEKLGNKDLIRSVPAGALAIYREAARQEIEALILKKINPHAYLVQEQKQSRAVARHAAKGEYQEALQAKHKQLRQFYLYREALRVQAQASKDQAYLAKTKRRKMDPKQIHPDYISNVKVMLQLVDLRKTPTATDIEGRLAKVIKFIEAQKEAGMAPGLIADDYFNQIQDWRNMTPTELNNMRQGIENMLKVGRSLSDEEYAKVQKEANEAIEVLEESTDKRAKPSEIDDQTWYETLQSWAKRMSQDQIALYTDIRNFDGYEAHGVWYRNVMLPIIDASNKRLNMDMEASKQLNDMFTPFAGKLKRTSMKILKRYAGRAESLEEGLLTRPLEGGGKWTLSAGQRVMLAVYWGSPESRKALLDSGYQDQAITEADVQIMLDLLTEDQKKLINQIWEFNEQYWSELARIQKELTGVAPVKVDHVPFKAGKTTMPGGYQRIYYHWSPKDGFKSDMHDEAQRSMNVSNRVSQSKTGATIERKGAGGRKIMLEVNNVFRAGEDVIQFIAFAEASAQVQRFMNAPGIAAAIIKVHGKEKYQSFLDAASGVFAGNVASPDPISRAMRYVRSNLSIAYLTLSIRNMIQQPLALTNSFGRNGEFRTMKALMVLATHPIETVKWIEERSEFMQNRNKLINREVQEQQQVIEKAGTQGWIAQRRFVLQVIGDAVGTYPTWLASYWTALDDPNIVGKYATPEEVQKAAYDFADQETAALMGSGQKKDLAPIFQGSGAVASGVGAEAAKQLTFMGTFFGMNYNLYADAWSRMRGRKISKAQYIHEMLWYLVIPAIWGKILVERWPDEDEDEGWGEWMAAAIAEFGLSASMVWRNLASQFKGFDSSIPAFEFFGGIERLTGEIMELTDEDEEFDKSDAASIIRSVQPLLPIVGSGQIARSLEQAQSVEEGEEDPSLYNKLIKGKKR